MKSEEKSSINTNVIYNIVEIYHSFMGRDTNVMARQKFYLKSFGAQFSYFFSNKQLSGFTGDVNYMIIRNYFLI